MHELETLLGRLKIEHLGYWMESLLEQAAQEWSGRHQCGIESPLKQARLPWVKTLEQFDFSFQPGIDRKVVRACRPGVRRAKRKRDPAGPTGRGQNASGGGAGRESG